MKKIFCLLFLTGWITSCSSDTAQIDNLEVVGIWQWKSTDGGFAFHIHENPETTGKNIELHLGHNSTYIIRENGDEISSGTYSLMLKRSIYSAEMEKYISYSNAFQIDGVVISGMISISEPQILNISDNTPDGLGSSFEKME